MLKKAFKKRYFCRNYIETIIILIASVILIYFLLALYFTKHFFLNTFINGVNVSGKKLEDANRTIQSHLTSYKLQLIERNGVIETISGADIGLAYEPGVHLQNIYQEQEAFLWFRALLGKQKYRVTSLYTYDEQKMQNLLNQLQCVRGPVTEPKNAGFIYNNGSYQITKEVYGNQVIKEKLSQAIINALLSSKTSLDLDEANCYANPRYISTSEKTLQTKALLDRYVATRITYLFGDETEVLSGDIIHNWLHVDYNLDISLSKASIKSFVLELAKKYNTMGITRRFKTTGGNIVEVKGGYYGWLIDQEAEINAIISSITRGEIIEKEPAYLQRALHRGEDDIGDTYIEINITKQHLWFYKDGQLMVHGSVVTGNPNRGYSTAPGTYMLNYKQKGAILKGPGYEVKVNYWMPFNGNIGIHDAYWRYSFGGEIYKRNGSHGCVNAPKYLAKILFENIEDGIPIICYEE